MSKSTFILPVPVEIQLIIFKFEHEIKFKSVLHKLLAKKCKYCEFGFYRFFAPDETFKEKRACMKCNIYIFAFQPVNPVWTC